MASGSRRARRVKLLVGAAIIAASIGYLVYGGMQDTLVYFVTPSELQAKGVTAYGRSLRLGGLVQEGSWARQNGTLQHTFVLADETATVRVMFRGIPPDLFGEGRGALVEGSYGADGLFHARTILAKHSEEYQAVEDHASKDARANMFKSVIKANPR
jgi:cytochrome c-type biogenesis protein CcmE